MCRRTLSLHSVPASCPSKDRVWCAAVPRFSDLPGCEVTAVRHKRDGKTDGRARQTTAPAPVACGINPYSGQPGRHCLFPAKPELRWHSDANPVPERCGQNHSSWVRTIWRPARAAWTGSGYGVPHSGLSHRRRGSVPARAELSDSISVLFLSPSACGSHAETASHPVLPPAFLSAD